MAEGCIGKRTKLATIEQLQGTTSGFPVETWTTLRTAYLERMDSGGVERLKADQISAKVDSVWKVEYAADMDPESIDVPKMRRLVVSGRTYDITHATIDPEYPVKRYVVLETIAKVG